MAGYQTQNTIIAKQELFLDTVDHSMLWPSVVPYLPDKVKQFITGVKQALCAQKVDQAQLHRNVEFLVDSEHIVPSLQQLVNVGLLCPHTS